MSELRPWFEIDEIRRRPRQSWDRSKVTGWIYRARLRWKDVTVNAILDREAYEKLKAAGIEEIVEEAEAPLCCKHCGRVMAVCSGPNMCDDRAR